MTDDFKKDYVLKLSGLTEEERKKRELYLKKLNNGQIQGPLTNVPYFDEYWVTKYTDETLMNSYPKMSMWEFLYENNKNHLDDIAIIYPGKKITYKELFENIDKCANVLLKSNIKEGDSIALPLPTTPESVYLFYAAMKIGAVANLIDLRKDIDEINYCLKICNSKCMFTLDLAKKKLLKCLDGTNVSEVISLSATESLPKPIQFVANPKQFIKNIKDNNKERDYVTFKEFIKRDDGNRNFEKLEYKKDREAFVVYTSGTTGVPKAVLLSADTANYKVKQYMTNGMLYERQDKYLNVIPLFLAFGSIIGLHLPLCMGMQDVLVPSYDIEKTLDLLVKNKPNHMSLTPASYRKLIATKGFDKCDLSYVKTFGCGGDGISAEEEKMINASLKKQGAVQQLNNGYGGSETGAPFSTQRDGVTVPGTVGVPLPGNNLIIIDHKTGEILEKNQVGDIIMVIDTPMKEYISKPELTEQTKIDLGSGRYGIKLNDAGVIDDEGNLTVKGRYLDAVYDNDKQVYWPMDIENLAFKTGLVKQCAAISMEENINFVIYVVLLDENKESDFELLFSDLLISNGMENLQYDVRYTNQLALSPNGKVDKKKYKEEYSLVSTKVI